MRTNLINTGAYIAEEKPTTNSNSNSKLDMVIAFDTTGSMYSYLRAVKDHVKSLIPELIGNNSDMRIGIVAFGDYCDMESATVFGKAYQVLNPTNNIEAIIDFISKAEVTSGGDNDEFYELVIKKITEETPWREDAKKSVLLIADAEPHDVNYRYWGTKRGIDWKKEALESAKLGITWDTLSIHEDYRKNFYEKLASMTNGVFAPFRSSNKTDNLIRASVYAKTAVTRKAFFKAAESAASDAELTQVFTCYSKTLND